MTAHQLFHKGDPDTSREAAESIVSTIPSQHVLIMEMFATDLMLAAEQIGWLLDMTHVQVNRRLGELVTKGKIERTDEKHQNTSGRWAYKYRRVT